MLFVGNRHANEIAALSLSLLKTLKYMREYSSKFPQVQIRSVAKKSTQDKKYLH